ncbi:MAG TPA: aspartate-semialdehyde dehydrogenase [Thermoplasmata archaeon]|jgi:aspartate-semialdehyde dehydrogenase|nr:aspartate-semialdehyde dehydrogenase [Thermoplasmata archaeon]
MSKIPVAVLGATGNIGQRFVSLLQDHPSFELAALSSSERKVGGRLGDFWRLEDAPLDSRVASMELQPLDVEVLRKRDIVAAFSALPSEVAADLEREAARAGVRIFSNASPHRLDEDVPLLVPEVNPDHLALVERQPTFRDGGFVVTNPNCSITGLALALKPLSDAFDLSEVHAATYQALSGAGYPGVPSLDITANVVPFIENEEEKMRREAKKILGRWSDGIAPSSIDVWANCVRVAVREGHLEAISIPLAEDVDPTEVARILASFRGEPQRRELPTAPKQPVIVRGEPNRPQPLLDAMAGEPTRARGMAATVGRIRVVGRNLRFFVLSHNTIRGGAGGSVLNAELAQRRGYLG